MVTVISLLYPGSHIDPNLVVGTGGGWLRLITSTPWGCHVYILSLNSQLPTNKACFGIHADDGIQPLLMHAIVVPLVDVHRQAHHTGLQRHLTW